MFSSIRSFAITTTLAIAATACSAHDARPALDATGAIACPGGIVHDDADAARFTSCQTIVGDLKIVGSDLTDLAAFSQVRSVSGKLVVSGNDKLISLKGLKGLERARTVEIENNPLVCAYFGMLPGLEHVAEPVVLRQNRGLSKRDVNELLERVQVQSEGSDEAVKQASL